MRIYCDMDGVLADFDVGYAKVMGRPVVPRDYHQELGDKEWDEIHAAAPNFFRNLPLMPDALELWAYIAPHEPIILTGVPQRISPCGNQKVDFAHDHFGPTVPIICCRSREKFYHCRPGDVLIDDWEKYRSLWEAAGGLWITHTSAATTIERLKEMGL